MHHHRRFLIGLALALLPALGPTLGAQEDAAPEAQAGLTLEGLDILPADPGVDTLCRLTVRVANHGDRPASQLGFEVWVGGTLLPVYRNQLFMQNLPPGVTSEVPLYNFWTTETSRPAPADGKLRVEVKLVEASWYKIEDVVEDGETIEDWTPLAAIDGLPSSVSTTLTLR